MQKKRLGIFPNLGKENVCIALPEFIQLCKDWGLEPVLPEEVAQQYGVSSYNKSEPQTLKTLDYGVSLGGDGTLLQMARHLAPLDVPAFGINFGKLGFLAEIDLQGMYKAAVWHRATIRWKAAVCCRPELSAAISCLLRRMRSTI